MFIKKRLITTDMEGQEIETIKSYDNCDKFFNDRNLRRCVENICFEPKKGSIVTINGRKYLNNFAGYPIMPVESSAKVQRFIEHIEYLFDGDKKRAGDFIDWLAYGVKNFSKGSTAWYIWSQTQGIGKSLINLALQRIMNNNRQQMVASLNPDELTTDFNSIISNKVFLVLDDSGKIDDKNISVLNKLITDTPIMINEKYVTQRLETSRGNLLILSNVADGLKVTGDTRRFNVFQSLASRKDDGYYESLGKMISEDKEFILACFIFSYRET